MNLDGLPVDVLLEILKFLDIKDVISLRHVGIVIILTFIR